MKILDHYIGRAVVSGTLLALAVLLALFTFFSFVDHMSEVGKGNFGIWNVIEYVILTMPRRAFELFPIAAVIGTLLGLGALAGNSELTVIRASGISIGRITLAVMKGGAVLMGVALFLGEVVAPPAQELAQSRRSLALSQNLAMNTGDGFWTKDGMTFINIRSLLSEDTMADIHIYEFDETHRLRMATHAKRATYRDENWLLEDIQQSELSEKGVTSRKLVKAEWNSVLGPDIINVAVVKPDYMSIWGLYKYIRYLRENGQESAPYELGFWGKLMAPVFTGVMIFLAVPFVFGPLRSVGVGQRILVGTMVGIGFHILNQAFSKMGLVYGLSPLLSVTIPAMLFLAVALWMMRRTF
ncbi:MAG: LPS export ABC transporter permease LptG [Gammaproteobacteria bacterium]|nr:LPS export ABC transporter permease LptG [Gammaproteobacteria bacterium]